MSYYTGRGDYYSGKGDPGLFSTIGNFARGLAGVASKLPGPAGLVGSAVSRVIGTGSTGSPPPSTSLRLPTPRPAIPTPTPGIGGTLARAIPGGSSGYQCSSGNGCGTGYHLDKTTRTKCVRNRKKNYTNPAALSRAVKRVDGFVSIAKKALKSTNYKVVNKSYKQNWRKPLKK